MMEMDSLVDDDLIVNPEQRSACALVLDTSGSMSGRKIDELNEGLRVFAEELEADELARSRVEVGIVTFGGGVDVAQDFVSAERFTPPRLTAGGTTPMGQAIETALDLLRSRKDEYKNSGVPYTRPWLFLMSDGAPTDEWRGAAKRLVEEENRGGVVTYAVAVETADMSVLETMSEKRPPLKLKGLEFRELFVWLSQSQGRVSRSGPGDQTQLPAVDGWAEVPS